MAKSSRSSAIKKNNQNLKKKVFGPVETARNERQAAKLLELAQQPKPLRPEMEVEKEGGKEDKSAEGDPAIAMDVDGADAAAKSERSNRSIERQRHANMKKPERRHRKAKNNVVFKKHPMKPGKKVKR